MLNVIRMEINRLFRSKSLYIALAICAGILILFTMILGALMDFTESFAENPDMTVSAGDTATGLAVSEADFSAGVTISASDASLAPSPNPVSFCSSTVSGLCILFVVIYTASFVHSFYKDGYSKNVIGCVKYRYYFQIAKTVCVAAISAVFLFGASIVAIIAAAITIKSFTLAHMGLYFVFLLGEFFLLNAVGLLSAFLTELTLGKVTAIVYILLASTNLVSGILSLLESKLSQLLHTEVELSNFLPSLYHSSFNISTTDTASNGGHLAHALVLSIVFIAIYNAAGAYLITKRDVK